MKQKQFQKKYAKFFKGAILDLDAPNNKHNLQVLMDIAYEFYKMGMEDKLEQIMEQIK